MNLYKKVAVLTVLALAIGISSFTFKNLKSVDNKGNEVKLINVAGEMTESFNSLDGLKQKASAIVEVNVIDSKTIVFNDIPFTISTAKVISSEKGKFNKDEEIKLIESGGKYKLSGNNPKEVKGTEVEWAFEGVRVMQPGEHLVLFVKEFIGPQIENAYIPLGVFQGKFNVDKDGIVNQQKISEHTIKDYDNKMNINSFKEKIKESS